MNLKVVTYKISLNSSNIFNLRRNPIELRKLVFNSINQKHSQIFKKGKFQYAMQVIEDKRYNDKNIMTGRIIKYIAIDGIEKWLEKEQMVVNIIEENSIIEKVYFVYEENSEYLFIEERSKLDIEIFKAAFTYIINYNNMELNIDLNPILHEEEIKKRIKRIKKIVWAHFEIIPNNPDQKAWSMFETINERIGSTSSIYDFKNNDGLNYSEEVDELITDVNKGKSRRYLIGGYNGEDTYDEVRSHEFIKRIYRNVNSTDEGRKRGLWMIMKEVLDL
ncbi:hypothetical protein [Clostridium estertheticum]|uniref:hypothetical protein n=1 Tax=Clostridium estertheticum TaxID=238834 RepID=UPI001C0B9FD6|nr:hypothetical protein [Clostridium estertheticum]MBU3071933.1 hypothetical protein [Clostridium estertheticum]MBU3162025.1 hypothetical protein [Clostridium estertheticum]